jgi:Rieske Fe-S protein
MTPPSDAGSPQPRRNVLSLLVGGMLASLFAPVAYVAGRYLRRPNRMPVTLSLGPESSIQPGSARLVKLGLSDAIVLRDEEGITAFNLRCTHAGCNVTWHARELQFHCPCHGGIFDSTGNVVKGPPKRPLDRLDVQIDNGIVKVSNG